MPSFTSRFHLPHPGGTEHVAREKAATEEKKHLRWEKARKHMERQKHRTSPSDDDNDDDDDNEDIEDKDLAVLQGILDAPQRSNYTLGLSGADRLASAADDEGATQKRPAPSPPQRSCSTLGIKCKEEM